MTSPVLSLLVSYTASAVTRVRVSAIPATPTDDFRDGFGGFRSLAFFSLLDLQLVFGVPQQRTSADSSSRDALLASISIRVQAAAAIRSRHAACSSQQAVTSSARLHTAGTSSSSTQHATDVQRKNALPAPLDHRMGAGPDIDAAEAHRVPGRHRRRHERASCGCGRDRCVREATDRPTRRRDPLL